MDRRKEQSPDELAGSGSRPALDTDGASEDARLPAGGDASLTLPFSDDAPTLVTPRPHEISISDRDAERLHQGGLFASGELVANRFTIRRLLGRGGMGAVYEAHDREMNTVVALKTILPERDGSGNALARFKREIQVARLVTSHNVCRTFDIGYHALPDGQSVIFVTMEYLRGQTLSEWLAKRPPLSIDEALPLIRQMANGLEATHQKGVVHRDFKSSNVMLVEEMGTLRAVITDFGLARLADGDTDSAGLTRGPVGSPNYMAPEQVEGRTATPATDVYAFGVVIYEMLTGQWPYTGDNVQQLMFRRLSEPPTPPREYNASIEERVERVILKCLARQPGERYQTPDQVVSALAVNSSDALTPTRRRTAPTLAITGAVATVIVAGLLFQNIRAPRKPHAQTSQAAAPATAAARVALPATPKTLRRSIAVLGFKNLSGRSDSAWLSTALAEMLASELAAGEKLRVISGEDVARMKIDLRMPDADSLSADTLGRIRANLRNDFVVLGSYLVTGTGASSKIRLDLRLQETAGEGILASVIANGTEADLSELVSRTATQLRDKLEIGKILPAEAIAIQASLPAGAEALRLYSEGLAKLRTFNALGARDDLERAVAADPKHALAHAALAQAWSQLGYDVKAKEEANKAFDLSRNLSREERLLAEARHHEVTKAWDKAIETYRILWNFAPDNLDYGLRLASAETSAGKPKDALIVITALRKLPPPANDDPRIDMAEAVTARALGDDKRRQALAARVAERGAKDGLQLLVAQARLQEASAFYGLGEYQRARSSAEEARKIYAAVGDRSGVAKSLNIVAVVLEEQGDLAGAKKVYAESLAIARAIGDKTGVANSLNNIATAVWNEGDLAGAKKMFEESIATLRETGNRMGVASSLNNTAVVLGDQGDLAGAKKMNEEALAIRREMGNKSGVAMSLINLAEVGYKQGDLAAAKRSASEALSLAREMDAKSHEAYALDPLGAVAAAEGDLSRARSHYQAALAIRETAGEKLTAAVDRMALAALSIEEGRAADAVGAARQAVAFFHAEHDDDAEAEARALLARALLAMRSVSEARQEIARAEMLVEKSQKVLLRNSIAVPAARIRAASKAPADVAVAHRALESLLAAAVKRGALTSAFEIRLALGELEMTARNPAVARARLTALERDAQSKGFRLIARKAALLRQ